LRIIINPADEEALKRIINFPGRGIGQTTIDRLIVSANEYDKSIFEVLKNLHELPININGGTKTKLQNFATMI
jgi:DNA helicase-2/ATP-dependent DNA helicase PcrA